MVAKQIVSRYSKANERIGLSVRVAHTVHGYGKNTIARFHRVVMCLIPVKYKTPRTSHIVIG